MGNRQAASQAGRGLALAQMVQRHIRVGRLIVVERRVALAERAASAVLAAQTHRHPTQCQRAEGECLGEPPVDASLVEAGSPLCELPRQLGMRLETVRCALETVENQPQ